MPALPPVPGVLKVVAFGETPVFPWANVFHVQYSGLTPSAATLGQFAANFFDEWISQFVPLAPVPVIFQGIDIVDLSSDMGNHNTVTGPATPGTNPHDKLPGNVAALISKGIARRYRGGHPRSYFYLGGDGDLQDTGHWNNAFLNALTIAYQNWNALMASDSHNGTNLVEEVIVSYIDKASNPVPPYRRVVPLVMSVLELFAQPEIASQRRRIGR